MPPTRRSDSPPEAGRTKAEGSEATGSASSNIRQLPVRRPARGRLGRIRQSVLGELRSRPFGYVVFACFALAGPFVVQFLFPEVSPLVGLVGGICFGAYAALCAVPQKFL